MTPSARLPAVERLTACYVNAMIPRRGKYLSILVSRTQVGRGRRQQRERKLASGLRTVSKYVAALPPPTDGGKRRRSSPSVRRTDREMEHGYQQSRVKRAVRFSEESVRRNA